ncbi:MAG: hypothetical protein AVDCRST_MAG19-2885 [uncultured Thermomicrobiales bacterium]|uniref:Uncharacterized protein n=1 Tax=uncultured Thermomicrobiales bacterium TaxID=1645740 RepID=A0A6J4VC88_9BACT|nr:MAG: hypothetical protein AVDCRST_MAG19-2885 [uncultured Thermomicrobiales bacterium]
MRPRPAAGPAVRAVALLLVLLGGVLVVIALFADPLGLSEVGDRSGDGLGWTQLVAAIVGLILLLGGVAWLWQPPVGRDLDEPRE